MIAATSQRRVGVSRPLITQRISVRKVTARLRWSANRLAGLGGRHDVRFDHVLARLGDRMPIEPDRGARDLQVDL